MRFIIIFLARNFGMRPYSQHFTDTHMYPAMLKSSHDPIILNIEQSTRQALAIAAAVEQGDSIFGIATLANSQAEIQWRTSRNAATVVFFSAGLGAENHGLEIC